MKSIRLSLSGHATGAALVLSVFCSPFSSGQQAAPNPANPLPQAGLTIEPEPAKQPPSTKFTNTTEREMAVAYGAEKFSVKPGDSKSVATPPGQVDVKVAVVVGKENRMWYQSVAGPNVRKVFVPRNWVKAKKVP